MDRHIRVRLKKGRRGLGRLLPCQEVGVGLFLLNALSVSTAAFSAAGVDPKLGAQQDQLCGTYRSLVITCSGTGALPKLSTTRIYYCSQPFCMSTATCLPRYFWHTVCLEEMVPSCPGCSTFFAFAVIFQFLRRSIDRGGCGPCQPRQQPPSLGSQSSAAGAGHLRRPPLWCLLANLAGHSLGDNGTL